VALDSGDLHILALEYAEIIVHNYWGLSGENCTRSRKLWIKTGKEAGLKSRPFSWPV